jgi:diaminopimelate decarboxylase
MFGLQVGPSGRLHLRAVDLVELVAEHGSPLHVVDGDHLDRAASEALGPFRDPDRLGADIYYSYKTNPVPAVLRRLHDAGVGAEVISEYELWLALKLGVPGPRIIYNGPAKSGASLQLAIERDVRIINANSLGEIERIAAAAEEVGRPAPLGLRVALPGGWGGPSPVTPSSSSPRYSTSRPTPTLRMQSLTPGSTWPRRWPASTTNCSAHPNRPQRPPAPIDWPA